MTSIMPRLRHNKTISTEEREVVVLPNLKPETNNNNPTREEERKRDSQPSGGQASRKIQSKCTHKKSIKKAVPKEETIWALLRVANAFKQLVYKSFSNNSDIRKGKN